MKILSTLLFLSLICPTVGFAKRSSRCVYKLNYKIAKEINKEYRWCLDGFSEDGEGFFYTSKKHVLRGLTVEECIERAQNSIGQREDFSFVMLPPAGMIVLNADLDKARCEGVAVELTKIKYRPGNLN